MYMSTVAKNFRIDSELSDQASKLLEGLGLSMSQAVSMFLRQVVLQQGLPFEVKYPKRSGELLDAIEEAKRLEADPRTKRYTDMNEMWADLDK
jgi:DNA-damage-inducible protein J